MNLHVDVLLGNLACIDLSLCITVAKRELGQHMFLSFSLIFENMGDVSIDGSYMPDSTMTYMKNAFHFL